MTLQFTGCEILAFGKCLPASCVVRNELNGWRKSDQVVVTMGQTVPNGLPYQPRPMPPGTHEITRVADCGENGDEAAYWPVYIDTSATQRVRVWELDERGCYLRPLYKWVTGRGYGIHHARYLKGGLMMPSNTTLGCINIASPDDAGWLGDQIRIAVGVRKHIYLEVPPWKQWET